MMDLLIMQSMDLVLGGIWVALDPEVLAVVLTQDADGGAEGAIVLAEGCGCINYLICE